MKIKIKYYCTFLLYCVKRWGKKNITHSTFGYSILICIAYKSFDLTGHRINYAKCERIGRNTLLLEEDL